MTSTIVLKPIARPSPANDAVRPHGSRAKRIRPGDPGKALARIVPEAGDLGAAAARARAYAADARAPSTRKAYAAGWKRFCEWCAERGLQPLPAPGELVATYLAHLADKGKKVATLNLWLVAICEAHRIAGFASPRDSPALRETWKGIRRRLGTAQKGKAPLHGQSLVKALRALPETLKGKRDRALLLLGFAGAFRRSELVALRVDDLQRNDAGFAVLLRRSKTDQEGSGRLVPIPREPDPDVCPVRAVDDWLRAAEITSGPLFRAVSRWGAVSARCLHDRGNVVAKLVKEAAKAARIDPAAFSGHSLRAGLVTAAAKAGRSMRSIKKTTGHRSDAMVEKYIRGLDLMEDVASSGLLAGSGSGAR